MVQKTTHEILLVEDNAPDAHLARRALQHSSYRSNVLHARDGIEALAILRCEGIFAGCPRPDLIFLDLNLPGKDGRQVLTEMRRDAALSAIPVVILSTSADEGHIAEAYKLGTNSYIVKPVELRDFFSVMETTQDYWFRICSLPSGV